MIRLIILLLLLFTYPSNAEIPEDVKPPLFNAHNPVLCDKPDEIINIVKNWGELPYIKFEGVSPSEEGLLLKTSVILGYNKETGTWSLVELISDEVACIIGNGKGIHFLKLIKDLST